MQMKEVVELNSGTPQFRIQESLDSDAPTYLFYGQQEMEDDLARVEAYGRNKKLIRTFDSVCTLERGDLIFSLISGKATIVSSSHDGYLYTQNYVRLAPSPEIDARYLAFILNESIDIRHQLYSGQQGSATLKFTLKLLKDLLLPALPSLDKQEIIGELYFVQLRLAALKRRVASAETTLVLGKLKEASNS
jgi:hypothetical protein